MRDGRFLRSSSPARLPASISAGSWTSASRPRSIPASRIAVPASARSAPASRARRSAASSRRSLPLPMLANRVERGRYLDSVALMRIARRLGELPGVEAAALMIGTPSNKALLADARLLSAESEASEPNDLVIAVRAADPGPALELASRLLAEPAVEQAERLRRTRTLEAGLALEPQANLALISVPGDFAAAAPRVAREVLERARRSAKRTVVCFLGAEETGIARTLTQAAEMAIGRKLDYTPPALAKVRGAVRGLYCGGTLAAEAALILRDAGAPGECVDLGDHRYTRSRPHPMIEPELRNEHIARAAADPAVGVLLFDVVLGYGAHADPAGVLIAALKGAQKPAIASVTGTEQDPQRWSLQAAALRAAGVHVAPSNAHAAVLAASVVSCASRRPPRPH